MHSEGTIWDAEDPGWGVQGKHSIHCAIALAPITIILETLMGERESPQSKALALYVFRFLSSVQHCMWPLRTARNVL